MIKKFRYFINPVEEEAKWLNEMSNRGYRLSRVGNTFHYFEEAEPGKYQYAVDYVANKSLGDLKDYQLFLDESKIRWIEKPASVGKVSFGNVRLRPYADLGGRIATSGGMIKREFLVLEKENGGEPFEIYTTVEDQIQAVKIRQKPYISLTIFLGIMLLLQISKSKPLLDWSFWSYRPSNRISLTLLGGLWGLIFINLIRFQLAIRKLSDQKEI